jgi:hypothetical protein
MGVVEGFSMLTDIFSNRYARTVMWTRFEERDQRFLAQAFGIIDEQLFPSGTSATKSKTAWGSVHDRLSTELGRSELSPKTYVYNYSEVGLFPIVTVCKNFVCQKYDGTPADRWMKERLSLIEIAFRERALALHAENAELDRQIESTPNASLAGRARAGLAGVRLPGKPAEGLRAIKERNSKAFEAAVGELNVRLQQAGYGLNFHNGFIQQSFDPALTAQVEAPFWSLLADTKWKNVDTDMKEAIDRRDNRGRDPAWYAARALESAIKIISDSKGWSTGSEKGAHNFLDNLGSKRSGNFIAGWEREVLQQFFTLIRNPLGHGPGSKPMPSLTTQQTDWAIGFCMIWVRSLVERSS